MTETVNTSQKKARSAKTKSAAEPKSTAKLNGTHVNGAAEATAAAKPRKTAAKKGKLLEMASPAGVSHEQVAQLAFRYWRERGCQHGHHEEDWRRAEHDLRAKAS